MCFLFTFTNPIIFYILIYHTPMDNSQEIIHQSIFALKPCPFAANIPYPHLSLPFTTLFYFKTFVNWFCKNFRISFLKCSFPCPHIVPQNDFIGFSNIPSTILIEPLSSTISANTCIMKVLYRDRDKVWLSYNSSNKTYESHVFIFFTRVEIPH